MELLSPHQKRIGTLVAQGHSNREIAETIGTSEQAIKNSIHSMFNKLGLWNRVELCNYFTTAVAGNDVAHKFEYQRLQAVAQIDSREEITERLDDLLCLAAMLCGTPIALLSIVEQRRLWFRSELGMGVREARREASFCEHAIRESKVFEVNDASTDSRFKDHPLVVQAPHIRFYAGASLITPEGYAVGSICVIDRERRELDEHQRHGLLRLGKVAMALMQHTPQTPAFDEIKPIRAFGKGNVMLSAK